jgi:ABC-2 type transport system permease protein
MLFASLGVLLTFSNVVTALSTYYLSEDLELVLALPLRRVEFHYARFVDTLVQSSWMMGLFGMPIFLAYGIRSDAPFSYYLGLAFTVPSLLILGTNLGIVVATLLVNGFSARRTREMMVVLTMVLIMALFVLIRAIRPERLVNAESFDNLAQFLAQVDFHQPTLFPPRWASEVIAATLTYRPFPWLEAGLLGSAVLASAALARWTTAWGFDTGWARAQESRAARFYRSTLFELLVRPLPRAWRPIVAKELRVFVRDPSQWSQVFLLAGICTIYLVSINALPLDVFKGPYLRFLQQAMSFVGLGMSGFIMAAIAARFQFTAVSREGRAFWLPRGAPVSPTTFLWAKAVVGYIPMIIVGLTATLGGGIMLETQTWLLVVEVITTLFLVFGIGGLAVAMGAWWPDFRAENAARAATGPAAVFFMVVALFLVFSVLCLEAGAGWLILRGRYVPVGYTLLGLAGGLCVFVGGWPLQRAAKALWDQGL